MSGFKLVNKDDSEILADLQTICPDISGFQWTGGDPDIDHTGPMGQREKSRVASYFKHQDYKKWVDV